MSVRQRGPALAVAATVVIALSIHVALALSIDGPRAFADELLYFDTGSSLAEGDGLAFRGEPYRYAPLYPALLAAVHVLAADREVVYALAKALNALVFALTAVPVFLLARRVLPPWPSAAAAALTVAVPSATYVSVVMTESLAYLASAWACLAIVLALEQPSALRQLGALLAICVAAGVRTQFLVLFGVYVIGLVLMPMLVAARRGRFTATLARLWPTVCFLALGAVALLVWSLEGARRGGPLGDYQALWRSYDGGEVARWLVYHLASLELYLAVLPFAVAPIAVVLLYVHARSGSERHAAFLALFSVANALLIAQVATFNSTEFAQGLFHDRPLFYVVPLWLVVFFVWIVEGMPRPLVAASLGAATALVLPFLLPYSVYTRDDLGQEFEAVPTVLWVTIDSLGAAGRGVLLTFAAFLVVTALVLPPKLRMVLPALVLIVFVLTAQLGWLSARSWSGIRAEAVPATERRWLDDRVSMDRSVTLLTSLGPCARFAYDGFYLTEFFNSSVERVAHLAQTPDHFTRRSGLSGRQVLTPSGEPLIADYVVAQPGIDLAGRRVAEGTRAGLVLWEVGGPVRLVRSARSARELQRRACAAAPR